MANCIVLFNEATRKTKFYGLLKKRFGSNEEKIFAYFTTVATDSGFKEDFISWYKEQRKTDAVPTFDSVDGRSIVTDVIKYYNRKRLDGSATVREQMDNKSVNYTNAAARNEGVVLTAKRLNNQFQHHVFVKRDIKGYSLGQLKHDCIMNYRNTFVSRVCDELGIDIEEFKARRDKNNARTEFKRLSDIGFSNDICNQYAWAIEEIRLCKELLGEDIIDEDRNFYALLDEILDIVPDENGISRSESFFDEVLNTKYTEPLRAVQNEFDDETESMAQQDVDIADGYDGFDTDANNVYEVDTYLRDLDSHSGIYASFTMHLNANIIAYFNSIPKLKSTYKINGEYEYDTNNAYGLSDTFTASEISTILYSMANDAHNAHEFAERIREIAERIEGFEGLIKIYDDLSGYNVTDNEGNTTHIDGNDDLKYQLWSVFQKNAIAKTEVYIDTDGKYHSRVTNNTSSKADSFRIQLCNDLANSAVTLLESNTMPLYNNLITKIKEINSKLGKGFVSQEDVNAPTIPYDKNSTLYAADINVLIENIYNALHLYYPTISKSAIRGFIKLNKDNDGNIDSVKNAELLVKQGGLFSIIAAANDTKAIYESRREEYRKRREHNLKLLEKEAAHEYVNLNEYESYADIWPDNGLSTTGKNVSSGIANKLLPYSLVKTEFNHTNVEGHNASDIINSSFITGMIKTLESVLNEDANDKTSPINLYAATKFRSEQYKYSNILLECRISDIVPGSKDTKIVNYGLFRLSGINPITGKPAYVPTEYATELLRFRLFDGVKDRASDKSVLMTGMDETDYNITAFISFFNPANLDIYTKNKNIKYADYFLKTPSDAPRNFLMTAPRYSIDNLFVVENKDVREADIKERLSAFKRIENKNIPAKSQKIDENVAARMIVGDYEDNMYLNQGTYNIINPSEDNKRVRIRIAAGNSEFIVEGDYVELDNDKRIAENLEFVGFLNGFTSSLKTKVENHYRTQLNEGTITTLNGESIIRTINRNHPIFLQFYNIALQEVNNAATALTTFFVKQPTDTFVDENGELHWTDKFALYEDQDNHTYENYHHAKDHKVAEKDNKGYYHLTGKVFTSDKFVYNNKFGGGQINFLEDLFKDGIATEEDGSIHLLYGGANTNLHFDDKGNVVLTNAQRNYVEQRIEQFINAIASDYVLYYDSVSNLLENADYTHDKAAEFGLNYALTYINSENILDGDSKFYKDFGDIFKREKEIQGSGVPYGFSDFRYTLGFNRVKIEDTILNRDKDIIDLNKKGILHDCEGYNMFRGVTVYNTIKTIEEKKLLKEQLIKNFTEEYKRSGIYNDKSAAAIEIKVDSIVNGLNDTKVNDAQSYITFEEWIRRIVARGQYWKYKNLILSICDESKPIDSRTIDEFVQVQKNFYYDLYYDKLTGTEAPRQIKNAEFVLIPRFIKGTELEKVYDSMIKFGIDQLNTVETTKAGKHNILTLWDNNGNLNEKWFNLADTEINSAIEYFDYNHLYTQQETPQHVNADNKASIQFMKKIVDNIPEYMPDGSKHPLYEYKKEFQKLYAYGIKENAKDLAKRLNLKLDENGNITVHADDTISGLNHEVFCELLKDECRRQGVDRQILDYVTLRENTPIKESDNERFGMDTKMPIQANNGLKIKLESISNALFNNNITRQKLPGFHAAQITGVGWKTTNKTVYRLRPEFAKEDLKKEISHTSWKRLTADVKEKYIPYNGVGISHNLAYHGATYKHKTTGEIITEHEYNQLPRKEEKDYEPNGPATNIEVLVPRNFVNFNLYDKDGNKKSDDILLAELQNAGLDEIIGYRIPTEGKQSMAVMKVVGFVDECYGSTIVVPDGWVAQTGSDFDIDSVYTIVQNNYTNEQTNTLEKVKYIANPTEHDYFSYIRHRVREELYLNITEEVTQLKEDIEKEYSTFNSRFESQQQRSNEFYKQLPFEVKQGIQKVHEELKNNTYDSSKDKYIDSLRKIIKYLDDYTPKNHNIKLFVNSYKAIQQGILDLLTNTEFTNFNDNLQQILEERLTYVEQVAKRAGLPSFEEYKQMDSIARNTKQARQNQLIDDALNILRSNLSLLEQMSQSNFRGIISAIHAVLTDEQLKEKEHRTPHDFLDQSRNMADAMSGRKLKGVSVASDNLVSICNTAKVRLTTPITITYPKEIIYTEKGKEKTASFSSLEEAKMRFGNAVRNTDGSITVKHYNFGWTGDNNNIVGSLLTAYSSQTTAHQLDIIKEMAVPNVNDYTFGIYKLFPSIGSDYFTAVAFMAQPAVSRIVAANNRGKSVYSNSYATPVYDVKKEIAKELGFRAEGVSQSEIDAWFNDKYGERVVLYYNNLKDRIDDKPSKEEQLVFDYAVADQFERLMNIANKIKEYSFVTNPDKFGAKQTIFATNQVFDRLGDILIDTDPIFAPVKINGEDVPFVEALYPGISKKDETGKRVYAGVEGYINAKVNDDDSVYIPMHYFLKYSSAMSVVVNRTLFATQSPQFRSIINHLENYFSGKKKQHTDKTYDAFEHYVNNYIFNKIDILTKKLYYDESTKHFSWVEDSSDILERRRLFGYGYSPNLVDANGNEFKIADLNNPTTDEIKAFIDLTPAQKVLYIQRNSTNPLVCGLLDVSISDNRSYRRHKGGAQVLTFRENGQNMEGIWSLFNDTFYNDNPLFSITAMDLIKYAYVVEGRNRSMSNVGKIIDNRAIIETREEGGTGIADDIRTKFEKEVNDIAVSIYPGGRLDGICDLFIRSHSGIKEIIHTSFTRTEKQRYVRDKVRCRDGELNFYHTESNHAFLVKKGIIYGPVDDFKPNKYVVIADKINGKNVSTLYKIEIGATTNNIVLIPVNLLEENEYTFWSLNPENNKYYDIDYYKAIINKARDNQGIVYDVNASGIISKEGHERPKYSYVNNTKVIEGFKLDDSLRAQINSHFVEHEISTLYSMNKHCAEITNEIGIEAARPINIDGELYIVKKIDISHLSPYLQNRTLEIKPEHQNQAELIRQARSWGADAKNVTTAWAISKEGQRYSTVIEKPIVEHATAADNAIRRIADSDNKAAADYVKRSKIEGINPNITSVGAKLNQALANMDKYVEKEVARIIDLMTVLPDAVDLNTDEGLNMTDDRVYDLFDINPNVHRNYLKTLLDANRLIEQFEIFDYSSYTEDEATAKYYADQISAKLDKLKKNRYYKEAERKYVEKYLAKKSGNPNIKNNILSIFDGYHRSTRLIAAFNDLQDENNTILQIVTKNSMANIRSKELFGIKLADEVEDKINKLLKSGARWDDIVGPDGKFKQEYNEKLVSDYSTLHSAKSNAYKAYKSFAGDRFHKAELFEKYLHTKLALDEFILSNFNREIDDSYYFADLQLTKSWIKNGKFDDIYVEYKMIQDEKSDIYDKKNADGSLSEDLLEELEKLNNAIFNLKSLEIDYGGGFIERKEKYEDFSSDPVQARQQHLDDFTAARKLAKYINDKSDLENKYHTYKEKNGFKDLVQKNLDIVTTWENRDPVTNELGRSQATLNNIPEYVAAKTWLAMNASFTHNIVTDSEFKTKGLSIEKVLADYADGKITEDSDDFKYVIYAANKFFSKQTGSETKSSSKLRVAIANNKARDQFGIIDGRKIPENDVKAIRDERLAKYGYAEDNPQSQRAIMHNSSSDKVVYTEDFYENMRVDGYDNATYKQIVADINAILRKVYNSETGKVNTAKLSTEDLEALIKLFVKLGYDRKTFKFNYDKAIKKHKGTSKESAKTVIDFINNNVDFELSDEDKAEFAMQEEYIRSLGNQYLHDLWRELNYELKDGKFVPNHLLWGNVKPKKSVEDKYIDKQRTAALRAFTYLYTTKTTRYYDEERTRLSREYGLHSKEYLDWFELNHVYNPYKHIYEPLPIWTTREVNPKVKQEVVPTFRMRDKNVSEGFENTKYKEGLGLFANFKRNEDEDTLIAKYKEENKDNPFVDIQDYKNAILPRSEYRNNYTTNQASLELKDYVSSVLSSLAKTKSAKNYLEKGYLPARAKHSNKFKDTWLVELGKMFGVVTNNEYLSWDGSEEIDYNIDYVPDMPMLRMLRNEESIERPVRKNFKTDEDFNKALKEYEDNKEENIKKNTEIHKAMLDNNWTSVIKEFILKASHYNAIQDEKYSLYFALDLLDHIGSFETKIGSGRELKRDDILSTDTEFVPKRTKDQYLIDQYKVWLHRVIFNQYKQNEGFWTKFGNILQSFTSTSYMAMNFRGGIANVTVGDSGMWAEARAREYTNEKDLFIAKRIYYTASPSYLAGMYKETSTSIPDAIFKFLHVVDYDELNGVVSQVDFEEWSKRVRDFGYFPNSSGEHMMQNTMLIAMMLSHHLVENPDYGKVGEPKYKIMNFEEYAATVREQAFKSIATPEQLQRYNTWIDRIKHTPQEAIDFAWYRDDPTGRFVKHNFTSEQRAKFKEFIDTTRKKLKKDFDKASSLYHQFELGSDKKLAIRKGSELDQMNVKSETEDVSPAYKALGEFKGRVISVNKKVHGNYGKLDAAKVEKSMIGRLGMQYHKHIPTGILKRYRTRGYYNEERGTIEKGSYIALIDFLTMPIKDLRAKGDITEKQEEALTGVQNVFNYIVDYFKFLKIHAETMPEYEKANLRRNLGDVAGVLLGVVGALILKVGWDDDEDSIAYNLALYEADRLVTEVFMWNPYGLPAEFRKQYSSPIAAQSIIKDMINIMSTTAGIILEGEDYDPYYHQGRFSGRHKVGVYIERRIPFYRNYTAIRDIADDNHYYKVGDVGLGMFPVKTWADNIKSW